MDFRIILLSAIFLWTIYRAYVGRGKISKITLCVVIVLIVSFTLFRIERLPIKEIELVPFQAFITLCNVGWSGHGKYIFIGLIGNILLFTPLGLCLSHKDGSLYKYPIPILVSLTVESIQYFTRLGTFEVDDLICNTIGGILGYEIGKQISGQRKGNFMIPGIYLATLGVCCLKSILLN